MLLRDPFISTLQMRRNNELPNGPNYSSQFTDNLIIFVDIYSPAKRYLMCFGQEMPFSSYETFY